MGFNFGRLLDIFKVVSKTKTFEKAQELAFKEIGKKLDASAHDPAAIKEIAKVMIEDAKELGGAVVKGTEAEHLVDPANIHRAADEPHPSAGGEPKAPHPTSGAAEAKEK